MLILSRNVIEIRSKTFTVKLKTALPYCRPPTDEHRRYKIPFRAIIII